MGAWGRSPELSSLWLATLSRPATALAPAIYCFANQQMLGSCLQNDNRRESRLTGSQTNGNTGRKKLAGSTSRNPLAPYEFQIPPAVQNSAGRIKFKLPPFSHHRAFSWRDTASGSLLPKGTKAKSAFKRTLATLPRQPALSGSTLNSLPEFRQLCTPCPRSGPEPCGDGGLYFALQPRFSKYPLKLLRTNKARNVALPQICCLTRPGLIC